MGRHAGAARDGGAPGVTEVLGWGAFTVVLVVGALVWFGVPWPVVAAVGATVLVGIGAVAAAMTLAPRRDPGQRSGGRHGSASEPDDHPPVP